MNQNIADENNGATLGSRLVDVAVSAGFGLFAFVLYLSTKAGYVFPGESAKLTALWRGLDTAEGAQYPLMGFFARMFDASNMLSVICGAIAVALVYSVARRFLASRVGGDFMSEHAVVTSRIGAAVAAAVFMFTPAVHEAATHLEPRMFDAMWALAVFAVAAWCERLPKALSWIPVAAAGVLAGLGLADSPVFLALAPLYIWTVWAGAGRGKSTPWGMSTLFFFSFAATFFIAAGAAEGDFSDLMKSLARMARDWFPDGAGWGFIAGFATVPFIISLFAARRSLSEDGGAISWTFHGAMTVMAVLSVATPLSPSAQMAPLAVLPVATSALAAFTMGYVASYWWLQARSAVRVNESNDSSSLAQRFARPVGLAGCGFLAVVVAFTLFLNFFQFDSKRGEFADVVARRVISDLGERRWLVTDGVLDNHLRVAAAEAGVPLNLVCLQRDTDSGYIKALSDTVRAEKLGGEKNTELLMSLSLGVLTFVQDWFAMGDEAPSKAAVWGAADLWYASGHRPVPELLFFGADPSRKTDFASEWPAFDEILHADEGWGSYRLSRNENLIERMRLDLRRHMGLVANNAGVALHDAGKPAAAYEMYELVLRKIDADNVCALFNEFELAREGGNPASSRKNELERELKKIVDDSDRRYRLWALANYYGYIRSPEIFIRLGFAWARSGRTGDAIQQFKRAIDFIPTERRNSLMNMMAAVYASENDQRKSRAIYEEVLEKDSQDHDALIGLMRLELLDGDGEKAMQYLERATAAIGDDPRANIEKAMLRMMRGELAEAKKLLVKATDADKENLQAWSMLAAVTMQEIDASKDEAEKKRLSKQLEDEILKTMEKQARSPSDYYVQTTRAFVLMRQGAEKRREARDAFVTAAKERPDIGSTSDIVLGLDIQLNDTIDAERHAREVLRRNRKAPLANYVMGSLALQRGEYTEAEAFLRRAVEGTKPVTLALNDLAEVLRRGGKFDEAEGFARKATVADPNLYVAWETLGSIILDRKGDLNEAEQCVLKACELSKGKDGRNEDVRMLISLARVQLAKGDKPRGKGTLRKVLGRIDELSDFERREFEEIRKSAK